MKRTVRSYLKPYWPAFVLALGQVLLISALELLKPWPLKIIIDNILSDNPLPFGLALNWSSETLLLAACAGLVVVYILLGGLRFLNDCATVRIGQGMGVLIFRFPADTMCIQTLTMNGFFSVLSASVLLAGMFVVMLALDTSLTLLALLVCPALFVAIGLLNKK